MERIRLARAGPEVSRIALGMWRAADRGESPRELRALVDEALDLGVTTHDHADIYGQGDCEELLGEAMAHAPGVRDRLELVTKCGIRPPADGRPKHYDTSREHIVGAVERSLRRLRTDRVDVLLIHRPDPLLDADEVADAFAELRRAGKVLHFGVSNFPPHALDLLASRLDLPFVTHQIELSPLCLDALHDGTLDHCQRLRTVPMAWSPLAGGRLFAEGPERVVRVREALRRVGEEHGGAPPGSVAIAWALRCPSRPVPVVGTGRPGRLRDAVRAAELPLTRPQWFEVWSASAGHEVP